MAHRGESGGFTLIELMIVVAIIAIISAIAIPNVLRGKIAANEAGAISNLRTIGTSEELYNTRNGEYCSMGDLYDLGAYIDGSLSTAVDAANAKAGYYYSLIISGGGDSWCCVARPSAWVTTGRRNFKLDQTGSIKFNTAEGSSDWSRPLGGPDPE